jgi:hypothetical protein
LGHCDFDGTLARLHQPPSINTIRLHMASSNVINREALMAENHTDIMFTPLRAIRGHLCFRCWMPHTNLKKCAGCRRVAYCGDQCQKIDWKIQHKKDCKKLRMVNEIESLETAPRRTAALWKSSLVCTSLFFVKKCWQLTWEQFQKTEVMKAAKAGQIVVQIIM